MYAISGYEDTPPNYYLNIYESDKNYEEIGFMDSIKLDYIPYQLTNTTHGDDESCFMLTGSDNKCHVYLYDRDNHCFGEANEDYVNDIFPELNEEFVNIPLCVSIFNDANISKRDVLRLQQKSNQATKTDNYSAKEWPY